MRLENNWRSASSVGVSHSFAASGHLTSDENRLALSSAHGVDGVEESWPAVAGCCATESGSAPSSMPEAAALIRETSRLTAFRLKKKRAWNRHGRARSELDDRHPFVFSITASPLQQLILAMIL
jgi:hypothetical protein